MVFASLPFMFFILPLFLVCDGAARLTGSVTARNAVMLALSLLFYTWGEAANVFLLLALGMVNYGAGLLVARSTRPRMYLAGFVALNLAVLVFFKYTFWLLSFITPSLMAKPLAMPLGISFFTFHAISYLVDIYRKHIDPARNGLDFLTYFCMFPHLVAGPIVRFAHVRAEMAARGPDRELFSFGMYRFLLGLNKKVLIADQVSLLADTAFSLSGSGHLAFFDAWIGITAYAIQIYFDFSGYSDMAIGLAAMAGFRFEENFRRPYSAASIRDFWHRWHISLSTWFRDYLYIPLGGSRRSEMSTYRNLLLVFFLCGLWHGADITFVIWGLWHGLFLLFERRGLGALVEKLPLFVSRGYVALVVLVGWVFFRAGTFDAAVAYLGVMASPSFAPAVLPYYSIAVAALAVGCVLCLISDQLLPCPTSGTPEAFPLEAYCLHGALAVVSVALLLTSTRSPFIYFNF